MTNPPLFYCGLDLGKLQDYTAFVVVEYRHAYLGRDAVTFQHLYDWDLRVRRLHRFPLGTSYRDLIGLIEHEMRHRALPRDTPLVIDASGVGEVMVDLFKGSAFPVVPVTITGGDRASLSNGRWRVPRQLLAETLAVLIEQEKLGVVADLPYARTLLEELASFDAEIRPTARVSFRPRGEQQHDDLVMALALACWYFRKLNPPVPSPAAMRLPFP
ncbi:MAG: hypothetical protein ACKV22_15485 [Bryobacteraceae bacterium]